MVQKADMNDKYDAIVDICNTFESENAAFYRWALCAHLHHHQLPTHTVIRKVDVAFF